MFIEIRNAKKQYGKGEAVVNALDGVDLSIEKGGISVILGPSGSGKSTLMNMLGGIDSLTSGDITVDGKNISKANARELTEYRRDDIGFVFQFYNLIADLTVQENIEVVAEISDSPLNINEVMEALDIEKYKKRFPRELSGGQQQRVAIARAMIKNPKLLLCDELTGALDTKTSRSVLEFVQKVNSQFGTTTVIITHNNAIADMADQVIVIRDGKIVEDRKNKNKLPASGLVL
ncbi:MAG: ABC transporter ATP-binding protein [Ruminococcus sp.]|nr:ABC transporter ATP-binding protein [Ruminococcus sp.]